MQKSAGNNQMRNIFKADYFFETIYDITPEFLTGIGVEAIVSDLDNTIADYDTLDPTPEIIEWLNAIRSCGIKLAIVSNNGEARVARFCKELEIPYFWKSKKPFPKTIHMAMEKLGTKSDKTVMLGDKLTTDVLGARFSGIPMLRVKSIKPRWKRSK